MKSVWSVPVNFNGLADTRMCLRSLRELTYPAETVVLIDNALRDEETREDVRRHQRPRSIIEVLPMATVDLATHYGPAFYQTANQASLRSAQVVMPLILDLIKPASVVDVGCGQGEWLSIAAAHGVEVYGVDGPHVADDQLFIPRETFQRHDLTRPLAIDRRFDLAMSVEVGEHLPHAICPEFVATLTRLAPAVVFSAALPGQGGIHHINEQWPWYWKELFERRGYVRLDAFRPAIWQNPDVAFYYQQNLYLFVDPKVHQGLIERIAVPDRLSELTLVKTTILQDMTRPSYVRRGLRKLAKMFGGKGAG